MPRIAPIEWSELGDEARSRIEAGETSGMYTMRLRSASLGDCEPCSLSRKDDSLSEEDVAGLAGGTCDASGRGDPVYTDRERLAIAMVDRMALDPSALDEAFLLEMAKVFTTEEIVEVGWYASQIVGGHRFMHMLDALGEDTPTIGM